MERLAQTPRADWRRRLEAGGFHFHSIDEHGVDQGAAARDDEFPYWREDVAYRFTEAQVETLYEATRELHSMCMDLVEDMIREGDLGRLTIPESAQRLIHQSHGRGDPHLYGRFDIAWDGQGDPKMLEYNADTPTSLIESAVSQWMWKEDVHPGADQFNSIHEALVARLGVIARWYGTNRLHVTGQSDIDEDRGNVEYLLDAAVQAGLQVRMLHLQDIGVTEDAQFVDGSDEPIELCFKLHPWEWMVGDAFGRYLEDAGTRWIEPPWKMLLSNKGLLPLLWERHRGHPNLLAAYFVPEPLAGEAYVKKPLLSREGANVSIIRDGKVIEAAPGGYGREGYVYQALARIPCWRDAARVSGQTVARTVHAVIGSWVINNEPVGICIREDLSAITKNTAFFVPHWFDN